MNKTHTDKKIEFDVYDVSLMYRIQKLLRENHIPKKDSLLFLFQRVDTPGDLTKDCCVNMA